MQTSGFGKRLAVLASSVALALLSSTTPAQHSNTDRVVAFGTSLSDTGNSFVWLSDPANAADEALDDLLIPDGPYAAGGHHYTNGATWLEGTARYLALGGNARPALENAGLEASNYATGGARAVDYPCRFNLPEQINAYVSDFPQTSARTLVALEIGSNDVRDALIAVAASGDPATATAIIQAALGNLGSSIVQLYGLGARRFLVLNVPDIGKTPAVRALDGAEPGISQFAGALSAAYNGGLQSVIQGLRALPGIDIRVVDIHATLDSIVADPAAYGFENVTDACLTPDVAPFKCAKPDSYVFWDGIHPTKAVHAIVAQQAIAAISAP